MVRGEERQVAFEADGIDAARLTWRAANPSVVSVTPNGRVRALSPGSAAIAGYGKDFDVRLPVQVATASLAWSSPLPLQPRTFLTLAPEGKVFAKTAATSCDEACSGELFVLNEAGQQVFNAKGIMRVRAASEAAWLETASGLLRYDYATDTTAQTGILGNLLALYSNGDAALSAGAFLLRVGAAGEVSRTDIGFHATGALILSDNEAIVYGDDRLWRLTGAELRPFVIEGPAIPWAADRQGGLLLTDESAYNFVHFAPRVGARMLSGVYSALFSNHGVVQSEGLSALLAVPIAAFTQSTLYLEMRTYGNSGQHHSFDFVHREGDIHYWRWGPADCADHPFAAAAGKGRVVLASCDRIVGINDETIVPSGAWPQPGADGGRSWRVQ